MQVADGDRYYAPLNECIHPPACHLSTVFELQDEEISTLECR